MLNHGAWLIVDQEIVPVLALCKRRISANPEKEGIYGL